MKTGLSLTQLAKELDRQSKAKYDVLVDTREMTLLPVTQHQEDPDAAPVFIPELQLPNDAGEFPLQGLPVRRQIGDHLKMPARFWDMLETEHHALLAHNVNTLFRERPSYRMVRAFDFGPDDRFARAFLSDRYLRRDNDAVAQAALTVLSELPEVQIPTAQITEKFMHLTAVLPRVQGEVKKGDIVQAGLRVTNSEIGWGALKVEPIILRLICLNGMTVAKATRVFHVGSQIDSDETLKVLSNETLKKDDEAFFAKLADVMRSAIDETQFNAIVAQMRESAESEKMVKPQKGLEVLGKRFDLGEGERDGILGHLIEGGDLTAYGALNAVTRFAQDVESYDRSMELEKVGGQILELAGTPAWGAVAHAE